MMKRIAITNKASIALISTIAIFSSTAHAAPPDRAAVRQVLEQMWESLATLEFQEEGFACDSRYQPDLSQGYSRRVYAFGPGGRRASQTWTVDPDGQTERIVSDLRRDGENRYLITYFPDDSGAISRVSVASDYETHEDSPTVPVHTMNFLTPFGKPLHRYLDDPATTLEAPRDDEGRGFVVLKTEVRGLPVRIELDPERDWLARRYAMGDVYESRALRFEQENGRWFPVESVTSTTGKDGTSYSKYVVTGLRINHPIPEERFRPPPLPDGVVILDEIKKESRVVGGSRALREQYERDHSSGTPEKRTTSVRSPATSVENPPASVDPEQFPWGITFGGVGVALLISALVLQLRRSRV